MARPLVCFDIDGTLIRTGGAGREALDQAFAELWGWPNATEGVHIAGSIDDVICKDVATKFGFSWTQNDTDRLAHRYLAALSSRLDVPGRAEILPGLPEILGWVGEIASTCLLTGNWRAGAQRKLAGTTLENRFAFGAFSEDAPTRNGLVPVARRRAGERGIAADIAVVVGDTIADIECARAGGAYVIVVETGFSEAGALTRAKPDLQVVNLSAGRAAILSFLSALACD